MNTPLLLDWASTIGDLFLMRACLGCNTALTRQEKFLCLSCLESLEPTQFHLRPGDNPAFRQLAGRVPLDGAYGMAYFDKGGTLQRLLRELKYGHQPQIGEWLGARYGRLLRKEGMSIQPEALVPVPLHRRKRRKRGYNQAERIAAGLSQALELPVLEGHIVRTTFTRTQTKLSGQRRYDNVAGAFSAPGPFPSSILLVDDIFTTGATLDACIKAILRAPVPPAHIQILTIGIARG